MRQGVSRREITAKGAIESVMPPCPYLPCARASLYVRPWLAPLGGLRKWLCRHRPAAILDGMRIRQASCACGQLHLECRGEPASVALCHCRDCQRRTGSAYGVAAFFSRGAITVSGRFTDFERPADSGHRVLHHFCPSCGSTVFWEPSRKPGMIAVAIGAFADPSFPPPGKAVFEEHRHAWATVQLGPELRPGGSEPSPPR